MAMPISALGSMRSIDKQIFDIAVPSIVSNITVPLLGLVDVAITGHLGAASYIGAVALSGILFNIIYMNFGFLRMGTSGLTAQSFGRGDKDNIVRLLARGLSISASLALLLILLQIPIREAAFLVMQPTETVRQFATTYFNICIWGAPAMLGQFALTGWFIGMQNSRIPMTIAIAQNIVNIAASLLLVYGVGMRVEGIALGTLTAQWCGFLMGLVMCRRKYFAGNKTFGKLHTLTYYLSPNTGKDNAATTSYKQFFVLNRDIFLRTLCIVSVLLFFTSAGSWQGETILAVNTLLTQLYMLVSYIMDGFANAGEALSGKFHGERKKSHISLTVRRIFFWGAAASVAFTAAYIAGGKQFLMLLTDERSVVGASMEYVVWAYLLPLCSMAAFMWDGVFIGLTASRQMLRSMLIATAVFFTVYFLTSATMGNHGLWLAMICFLAIRGVVQTMLYPGIIRRASASYG